MLALFTSITWGLITFVSKILENKFNYPSFLSEYFIYHVMYLIRVLAFLPLLMIIYKELLPSFDYSHQKFYIQCSILSTLCLVGGLFVQTKFWNYLLNGGLVSPLIEEIIARFVLYEARSKGFKIYTLIAIISSLSFGLMHFGYEPSTLLNTSTILPKLSMHAGFGLVLCSVFWFLPNLSILMIIHSFSNLYYTLTHISELGL
jgi:membrane protease YdiL (CAAX protease family)